MQFNRTELLILKNIRILFELFGKNFGKKRENFEKIS